MSVNLTKANNYVRYFFREIETTKKYGFYNSTEQNKFIFKFPSKLSLHQKAIIFNDFSNLFLLFLYGKKKTFSNFTFLKNRHDVRGSSECGACLYFFIQIGAVFCQTDRKNQKITALVYVVYCFLSTPIRSLFFLFRN